MHSEEKAGNHRAEWRVGEARRISGLLVSDDEGVGAFDQRYDLPENGVKVC
jgi:hypothetical protein